MRQETGDRRRETLDVRQTGDIRQTEVVRQTGYRQGGMIGDRRAEKDRESKEGQKRKVRKVT